MRWRRGSRAARAWNLRTQTVRTQHGLKRMKIDENGWQQPRDFGGRLAKIVQPIRLVSSDDVAVVAELRGQVGGGR